MIETGTSITLADAESLIANDIKFPTKSFMAVEKLYGWSIVVDIFHGVTHAISQNIRNAVQQIGPLLQRLEVQMGDSRSAGLDLICRIMYDMQQDYFQYLAKQSVEIATTVPDFQRVIELVATYRAEILSPLPAAWYLIVDCPAGRGTNVAAPPPTTPAAMRQPSSSATIVNAHADRRLVNRFKNSGQATITTMVGG